MSKSLDFCESRGMISTQVLDESTESAPLFMEKPAAPPRVYRHRRVYSGARHRREERDLQRRPRGTSQAASVSRSRSGGDIERTLAHNGYGARFSDHLDDWEHRNKVFSELAAFRHWENRTVEFPGAQPEPILQVTATTNYFHVLGFEPLFGRTHAAERAGGVNDAVLSYELWMRRFGGNRDVLGKTIRISGASFSIVGVMPPAPHDLGIGWGDVWTPIHWYNMQYNRATSYRARYLRVLGRLKPGLTMAQAHLTGNTITNRRLAMLLMILFAALALCAVGSYGVMSYAVNQRTAEIGIRMALGAEPGNILHLILSQGLRSAVAGTVAGLLGGLGLTSVLASLLYNAHGFDWMVDGGILVLASIVALAASYLPARRPMRIEPPRALRHG